MKTVLPSLSQAKEKKHMCASYWTLKVKMAAPFSIGMRPIYRYGIMTLQKNTI